MAKISYEGEEGGGIMYMALMIPFVMLRNPFY